MIQITGLSLSPHGTSGSLWCSCLLMFVSFVKRYLFTNYVKLGLVVGMTKQMSNGKEADSELLTLD